MAMTTKEYYRLEFVTDTLKTVGVNVKFPDRDKTAEEIKAVMETLAEKKIFASTAGICDTPKGATIIQTIKDTIDIE